MPAAIVDEAGSGLEVAGPVATQPLGMDGGERLVCGGGFDILPTQPLIVLNAVGTVILTDSTNPSPPPSPPPAYPGN